MRSQVFWLLLQKCRSCFDSVLVYCARSIDSCLNKCAQLAIGSQIHRRACLCATLNTKLVEVMVSAVPGMSFAEANVLCKIVSRSAKNFSGVSLPCSSRVSTTKLEAGIAFIPIVLACIQP